MKEPIRESVARLTKAAPWLCVAAVAVIAATFAYNKLYLLAVLFAPPMGLLAFSGILAYWRTGKATYANFVIILLLVVSGSSSRAGMLWGFPQTLAVTLLFTFLPMLFFRRTIIGWLARTAV